MQQNKVVSGNLNNSSYDTSKIINAKFAKLKIEINPDTVHDAIIKTLVYLWNVVNEKKIHSVNKLNGEINVNKLISNWKTIDGNDK